MKYQAKTNILLNLYKAKKYHEAIIYAKSLIKNRVSIELAYQVLGAAAQEVGDYLTSESAKKKNIEIDPKNATHHFNLGNLYAKIDRIENAISCYENSLNLDPMNADAANSLGVISMRTEDYAKAEIWFRRAASNRSAFYAAHSNLGNLYLKQMRYSDAIECYVRALELSPKSAEIRNNLGTCLKNRGRLIEAEIQYKTAIKINPKLSNTAYNLGLLYQDVNKQDLALQAFRLALSIDSLNYKALVGMGSSFMELKRFSESESALQQSLAINPTNSAAYTQLTLLKTQVGDYSAAFEAINMAIRFEPQKSSHYTILFFLLNLHPEVNLTQILKYYRNYDDICVLPKRQFWKPHQNDKSKSKKLRIGYVSPDFRIHVCHLYVEPLIANHDKDNFELYAFSELGRDDEVTARYKALFDHWIPTKGLSDEHVASLVREHQIDILVDLAGHTDNNRLDVFSYKPAPISMSWILGSGYMTGNSAIDYLLTDEIISPREYDEYLVEKAIRLPQNAFVYRPNRGMGPITPSPFTINGYITFGITARAIRINRHMLKLWAVILNGIPNSKIKFDFSSSPERALQIQGDFIGLGISADRVLISETKKSPWPWDFLNTVDILLDTQPETVQTSVLVAHFMGVPTVTMKGRPGPGRCAAHVLTYLGRKEWVADTPEGYCEIASELGKNPQRLLQLREALRSEFAQSCFRNEKLFAKQVENIYRDLWIAWCDK